MYVTKLRDRGESAALGRRMPWANRLFSKSMKTEIMNFLHEVEKMILVIAVHVSSKKLDFPSLKKKTSFSRDGSNFFVQSFSVLKLAILNFHF